MGEFIHFEDRSSDHPFIEKVWRCRSECADRFLSVAANTFEMAVTHLNGQRFFTLRGPETIARSVDCPPNGEWVCIRFKPGTFIPWLPPGVLRNGNDVTLPGASSGRFWLNGSAEEFPDFDNAEVFVKRLARDGILERDTIVDETLKGRSRNLSLRSAQRRFLRSTGVSFATFRQIRRARNAALMLREGASILDVVACGYFDQAHLTRSLRRFIGETPANIVRREKQLSFLYKTDLVPVASNVRAGTPTFNMLFPVICAAFAWGGLWLRERRLEQLLPLVRDARATSS